MNMQQAAQMQAMQQAMQRGYAPGGSFPGAMYQGYQAQPSGMGVPQGATAPGPGGPTAMAGMGGPGRVPGGGAADGGLSAAYAAWAAAYGGGYGGGMQAGCAGGGAKGSSSGVGEKGDGKGKGFGGFGKGKGKGKGWKGGMGSPFSGGYSGGPGADLGGASGDPRRQIELAQRRAKQRDRATISQAQRSAQQRFERDLLERIQGSWVDASDSSTSYVVEGGICAVSGGENSRTFRNRLGVYGGELCWDARRFWHRLDLNSLPPADETVERVEWSPGEGSPPTRPIIWIRGPPPVEVNGAEEGEAAAEEDGKEGEPAAEDDGKDDGEGDAEEPAPAPAVPEEATESTAEAVAEAAVA